MRLNLAARVSSGLLGALLLASAGSGVALFSTFRAGEALEQIVADNLDQARAIYELEIALLEQGGLVSSYLLDGNEAWIEALATRQAYFPSWLERVNRIPMSDTDRRLVRDIHTAFETYEQSRAQVIALYRAGEVDQARSALQERMNVHYDQVYQLCEQLSRSNNGEIEAALTARRRQTRWVTLWVTVCTVTSAGLIGGLLWLFFGRIWGPLRRVLREAEVPPGDEVRAVGTLVQSLRSDYHQARDRLAQSQQQLATVGRIAAGVAHEIRSPLAALKMRLYSLQQTLDRAPQHERDFEILFEEIARLDDIIRHFLEFSRLPEPQTGRVALEPILLGTLDLLRHEIATGNIRLECQIDPDLPPVLADAQQIRQVLINLIRNATEALVSRGVIRVTATSEISEPSTPVVVVRVQDNGPGVSEDIRERLFDPFVSTRESGVGLGLWIAKRIMEQHGGQLDLESWIPGCTVFAVRIPAAAGETHEPDSGRGR